MSALQGKRVVVTRAAHQAEDLNALLAAHGAEAVPFPCISITAPEDTAPLDAVLHKIEDFDWLIVTSANTVYALQQRLASLELTPAWTHIQVAAVGEATAAAVHDLLNTAVDLVPEEAYAHALADALPIDAGTRVFLPQSALAHVEMAERMRAKGAYVTAVTAYDNGTGEGGADVAAMLHAGEIDALTFTSSSTVENFIKRLEQDRDAVARDAVARDAVARDAVTRALILPAACIGAKTRETALEFGFQNTLIPENPGLESMIEELARYFKAKN